MINRLNALMLKPKQFHFNVKLLVLFLLASSIAFIPFFVHLKGAIVKRHVSPTTQVTPTQIRPILNLSVTDPTNTSIETQTLTKFKHTPAYTSIHEKIVRLKYLLNVGKSSHMLHPADLVGDYLLLNKQLCAHVTRVNVIIIVHTAPDHLLRRQRIRETFGNATLFSPYNVRIAFLLGKTSNWTLTRLLWAEYDRYHDSVMGDFIDDYKNLTLKGIMGYRWVSKYCPNSDLVLKIDDDVLVNTYKFLYSYFEHMRGKRRAIFCEHHRKDTHLVLREGKWEIERDKFYNVTNYPFDFCPGYIVFITTDLARLMYEASKITPFFWVDDVYLFGMLPYVVGGVQFYDLPLGEKLTRDMIETLFCIQVNGTACEIVGTLVTDENYWRYWNILLDLFTIPKITWKDEPMLVL